ncbi:hypothetical protein, partial [Escherichia coli]|uniref:hypothetical protein n=1 Tax=Escherichia coli TaxID=562 RepID=UPI003B992F9E
SLKTSIKTITYLSDIGCLEIQGASLPGYHYEPFRPAPGNRLNPNLLDLVTDGFASKICIPDSTLSWYSTGKL